MSPYSFDGSFVYVFGVGSVAGRDGVDASCAAVPAVSLKPEATVKRGTGAYNDPFVINTD